MKEESESLLSKSGSVTGAINSIIATGITFSFLLSIAHEFAFYFSIDLSLLSLLSATDYIKESFNWMPISAASLIWKLWGEISFSRALDKARANLQIASTAMFEKRVNKIIYRRRLIESIIFSLCVIPLLLSFPWPTSIFAIMIYLLSGSKRIYAILEQSIPGKMFGIAYVTTILLGLALFSGIYDGGMITSEIRFTHRLEIELKTKGANDFTSLYLIRYIERGIIALNGDKIVFLPWPSIEEMRTVYKPTSSITELIKEIVSLLKTYFSKSKA